MDEWADIVSLHRKGRVPSGRVAAYKHAPPLPGGGTSRGYSIPLDDDLLRHVARSIARSPLAAKRLGREWLAGESLVINKRSNDETWITREELRELDEVCTRFTTKRFFPDAYTRVNMIINIIRVYDHFAKITRQPYRIVFKGGVMIRLKILEFINDLNVDVRYDALDYVSEQQKAVGLSDFDFEIVPTDPGQSEAETRRQVLINSAVLLVIRRHIEQQMYHTSAGNAEAGAKLIDNEWDYAEAEQELRGMLRQRVASLPSTHPMSGCTVDHVHIRHPRRDPPSLQHTTRFGRRYPSERENICVFKCVEFGRDHTCIASMRDVLSELGCDQRILDLATTESGCLYNTTNHHIGEHAPRSRPGAMRSNFHLSRIKHSFILYYTTKTGERRVDRLSGELIDLSQSHGGTDDEIHAQLYADLPNPYTEYRIPQSDDTIRSYTIGGLLHDLQDVLHRGDTLPWQNAKGPKRVMRYAFLLVMQVMRQHEDLTVKTRALRRLVSYLEDPEAVRARRMRPSGFADIDRFAAHEHASLGMADPKQSDVHAYFASIRQHLSFCIDTVTRDAPARTGMRWHLSPLNAMYVEHDL